MRWKHALKTILFEIIGSALIAVGLYNFAVKADIPVSGFSGIAVILYRIFQLPIGLTTILLNVPVALFCYKYLGKKFFYRSLRCMIISSIFIDVLAPMFPVYQGERLLASLCAGILSGLGYALVYVRNSSTGGMDFIIMAVKKWKPYISVGKIAFLADLVIILAAGAIFQDIDGMLYGIIINYFYALVVDKVMYGMNAGKMSMVVTKRPEEVAKAIDESCQRGTTIFDTIGGYSHDENHVVMCACNSKQMYEVERAVKKVDPESFMIVLESNEVLGSGFRHIKMES